MQLSKGTGFVTQRSNQSKPLHSIITLTGHPSLKSLEDYAIGVSVVNEVADLL